MLLWFVFSPNSSNSGATVSRKVGIEVVPGMYVLQVLKAVKEEYGEILAGVGLQGLIYCDNNGVELGNDDIITQSMIAISKESPGQIKFTPVELTAATVAPVVGSPVAASRKRRWDALNNVLNINKKAIVLKNGNNSLGYSYASWEQIKEFFPIALGTVEDEPVEGLPEDLLSALHQYLCCASICFGSISEGHEAKRVHFIAPILIIVCSFFNGDIQILAEEVISGVRVHAHGHFEFVLKRGDKRICIVEAKKDDILQGKTQSLVGCESLCDVEELAVSYGIATNYLEWCFLKNEAEKITEEMLTVALKNGNPTMESLRTIANKIIAILE